MKLSLSLIIPLWNEERNIPNLLEMLSQSHVREKGLVEIILVNNGSADQTGTLIDAAAQKDPIFRPVHLPQNVNYGGGVYEGTRYARGTAIGYIPGDLQVHVDDVIKVWDRYCDEAGRRNNSKLMVKGHRVIRRDPFQTRLVSAVYTTLANLVLGVKVSDVNGLPKVFDASLIDLMPAERMKTFVFDAQLISIVRHRGWPMIEVPVSFLARREGVSSWSKKRMQTYRESFRSLFRLRELRYFAAVPREMVNEEPHRRVANEQN